MDQEPQEPRQPLPPASRGQKAIVLTVAALIVVAAFFILGTFLKWAVFG